MAKYSDLKTDAQRLAALDSIPYMDWVVVSDWEDESTDPTNKKIFHNRAVSLYHEEEYYAGCL